MKSCSVNQLKHLSKVFSLCQQYTRPQAYKRLQLFYGFNNKGGIKGGIKMVLK